MPTPKQAYIHTLNEVSARYGALEDDTARKLTAWLQSIRREIASEMAQATGWESYRRAQLVARIDALIAEYQTRLQVELATANTDATRYGAATVTQPLRAAGILDSAFYAPSTAQVNVLTDFSAELVRDISDQLRAEISKQIRVAALGNRTPQQAMQAITRSMGLTQAKGPVRGIAQRAETIIRTDMQRAFNLATYSQQEATGKIVDGLLKGWQATGDGRTRRGHLRAHQEYKDKPIPVGDKFKVYDIDGKGRVKGSAMLRYPGDPAAPAQYVVNCRCRAITIHPSLGRIGTSLDGRIAAELERRG